MKEYLKRTGSCSTSKGPRTHPSPVELISYKKRGGSVDDMAPGQSATTDAENQVNGDLGISDQEKKRITEPRQGNQTAARICPEKNVQGNQPKYGQRVGAPFVRKLKDLIIGGCASDEHIRKKVLKTFLCFVPLLCQIGGALCDGLIRFLPCCFTQSEGIARTASGMYALSLLCLMISPSKAKWWFPCLGPKIEKKKIKANILAFLANTDLLIVSGTLALLAWIYVQAITMDETCSPIEQNFWILLAASLSFKVIGSHFSFAGLLIKKNKVWGMWSFLLVFFLTAIVTYVVELSPAATVIYFKSKEGGLVRAATLPTNFLIRMLGGILSIGILVGLCYPVVMLLKVCK